MTRIKCFLACLAVVAAVLATAPKAHAHPCAGNNAITCHATGAGSSAQFLTAMIGADQLAYSNFTNSNTGGVCTFHWSAKNSANVIDTRDGSQLHPELGNIWLVWVATQDGGTCATSTGGTGVTDLWLDVSVDSTVGVRTFMAQLGSGQSNSGALVQIPNPLPSAGNLVNAGLLADGYANVTNLPSAVQSAIGSGTSGNDHINLGLTDIRPEDALFATARAYTGLTGGNCTGNGACSELGYATSDKRVGIGILTDQGTNTAAYPTDFALSGNDPFTGQQVRSYSTLPIGAAPIVFVYNNNSVATGDVYPVDLTTGITPGKHKTGQAYPLANLFDGDTACNTQNGAFTADGQTLRNVNLALREGLSGTMNTTEFNLFRSFGDTTNSQEKGIKPSLGSGPPGASNNPLDLDCTGGGGKRVRAIGTGEVVNYVHANNNALGYVFFSFSNLHNVVGTGNGANYNYMTLDGVDGIGIGTSGQQLTGSLDCGGPNCSTTLWPNSVSFPHVRDGSYKAWSLYRWLIDPNDDDSQGGPSALAANTQNVVDTTVADYIPFTTTNGSDPGLDVYRSHFKRCETGVYPCPSGGYDTPNNGSASGNTLGGGSEAGGDVGGLVQGPFPAIGKVHVTHNSKAVTWNLGPKFGTGSQWDGQTIDLGVTYPGGACSTGTPATIASVSSGTQLHLSKKYKGATGNIGSCTPVSTPGVLSKEQ